MIVESSSIVYRYRKDLLDQAVAATERHYREFLDYHGGKDLVVYPDGLSMAADEQRRFRQMYTVIPCNATTGGIDGVYAKVDAATQASCLFISG